MWYKIINPEFNSWLNGNIEGNAGKIEPEWPTLKPKSNMK